MVGEWNYLATHLPCNLFHKREWAEPTSKPNIRTKLMILHYSGNYYLIGHWGMTEKELLQGKEKKIWKIYFLACTNGDGTLKSIWWTCHWKSKKSQRNPRKKRLDHFYPIRKMVSRVDCDTSQEISGKEYVISMEYYASETQLTNDDSQIITMFLPPNGTPLTMDQYAIRLTTMYYRNRFLIHVLCLHENDILRVLKDITLNDAVFLLANSWDKLSPHAIAKCWKNIHMYLAIQLMTILLIPQQIQRLNGIQMTTSHCRFLKRDGCQWIKTDHNLLKLEMLQHINADNY